MDGDDDSSFDEKEDQKPEALPQKKEYIGAIGGGIFSTIKTAEKEKKRKRDKIKAIIDSGLTAVLKWIEKHTFPHKPKGNSKIRRILSGLYYLTMQYFSTLVFLVMLINAIIYGNVIALIYPLSMFGYAMMENPRPHKVNRDSSLISLTFFF